MFDKNLFEMKLYPDFRAGQVWQKMKDERLIDTVFYDGSIRTPEKFSEFVIRVRHFYACYYRGKLAGCFWLTHWENSKAARLHFCCFNAGRWILLQGAETVLDFLLGHYEVLYFFLPEVNKMGVKYALALCAIVLGKIPAMACIDGKRCPMITGYFTKGL